MNCLITDAIQPYSKEATMPKSKSDTNAISLLKNDHKTVKGLFEKFEAAEESSEKENIIAEAIEELKVHATVEEEIFYPAIREEVGDDLMNEAEVEHHVARMLIAELDQSTEDEEYRNAKFKVLAEAVKHHIKEEEGQMLPSAEELDMDFDALGEQMVQRKEELKSEGVPPDAEHEMLSGRQGRPRERTKMAGASKAAGRKSDNEKGMEPRKGRKEPRNA